MTTKSATFPFSMEPWVLERPMEWAELMVAAASVSSRLILWFTAARCITRGWNKWYWVDLLNAQKRSQKWTRRQDQKTKKNHRFVNFTPMLKTLQLPNRDPHFFGHWNIFPRMISRKRGMAEKWKLLLVTDISKSSSPELLWPPRIN